MYSLPSLPESVTAAAKAVRLHALSKQLPLPRVSPPPPTPQQVKGFFKRRINDLTSQNIAGSYYVIQQYREALYEARQDPEKCLRIFDELRFQIFRPTNPQMPPQFIVAEQEMMMRFCIMPHIYS